MNETYRILSNKKKYRTILLTAGRQAELHGAKGGSASNTAARLKMRLLNDHWTLLTKRSFVTNDLQRENLSSMA